jgi:hypothetical protein
MSRRSRYGRSQPASSRGFRPDGPRPDGFGPRRPQSSDSGPAVAPAAGSPAQGAVLPPLSPRDPLTALPAIDHAANGHDAAGPLPGIVGLNGGAHANGDQGTNGNGLGHPRAQEGYAGCTAPQLRRFIKSRTYVPMHELRRRFGINGGEDDVTLVQLDGRRIFVGLPNREGLLLGELLRGGEVGFELSFDPLTPIVVGVYPMRPVPRN